MKCLSKDVIRLKLLLAFALATALIMTDSLAVSSLRVEEVLSVKTGKAPREIGNQFGGGVTVYNLDPFDGFSVDSKGNILIEDRENGRIQVYSKKGKFIHSIGFQGKTPTFSPRGICLSSRDDIYVHNIAREEILVFSKTSLEVIRLFNPGAGVFSSLYRKVPIISLECHDEDVTVAYGIDRIDEIKPIYVDQYDLEFRLIKRTIFDEDRDYDKEVEKEHLIKGSWRAFRDVAGNAYCYPVTPTDTKLRKFQPLVKLSASGDIICTLDGEWLSRRTGYVVRTYPSIDGWGKYRGRQFLVINWYVTNDGAIYCLLANNDYVKVLRIVEKL
jgi:hypothetical protein